MAARSWIESEIIRYLQNIQVIRVEVANSKGNSQFPTATSVEAKF
jgi:hypothetical protein